MSAVAVEAVPVFDTAEYEAISLDDLVDEAELLKRVDRKYLVPNEVADWVMRGMHPLTRVLEINGMRDFAYDSVYFDTPDAHAYRMTAQKRRRRVKLRTRSYLDTGGCFLEVKTKSGRGATIKERMPYDAWNRASLTSQGKEFVQGVLDAAGVEIGALNELAPSLESRYRRTTLLIPEGSRATFDTNLAWSDASQTARLSGHTIIETKSAGSTSELDQVLWRSGYRPSGISKFGTGTAVLNPELPSNKWARVLRGPFNTHLDRTSHAKELS